MKKLLMIVGLLVVVSLGVFWSLRAKFFGVAESLWWPELRQAERAAEARAVTFCSDAAALGALQFASHGGHGNAGQLLNARVPWVSTIRLVDGGTSERSTRGEYALAPAVLERLRTRTIAELTEEDLLAVDSRWLEKLDAYDHWELTGDGSPLGPGGPDMASCPMPDFAQLTVIARVRETAAGLMMVAAVRGFLDLSPQPNP